MIPFATPSNGEVINLSQIVRLSQMTNGSIDVHYSNGEVISYSGDAAKFVNTEVAFALSMYRQWQLSTQQTIITPDNPPSRIM